MIHEHQEEYYQALNVSQHSGQCTDFVVFMLRLQRDLLQEIREGQVDNVGNHVGDHTEAVLMILRKQPKATARSIADLTHLSVRQAERILASLRDQGMIRRNGSARSGSWEVLV